MQDDAPGEEDHGEALAAALRVPHDAAAAVAVQARGLDGGGDGGVGGVELVVTGQDLDDVIVGIAVEDDAVADEVEEAPLVEHAPEEHFQLQQPGRRGFLPLDGAPGHEALFGSGEGADAGLQAVRSDQDFVVGEERRNLLLVGLKLLEGLPDGGVFVGGVLEFHDAERQAVDEDHHVWPAVVLTVHDGELIDGEPIVVCRIVEVHQANEVAGDSASAARVLHRHAVDEHAVEGAVVGDQGGMLGT